MSRIHFGKILMRLDHWNLLKDRFNEEMDYWNKAKKLNKGKPLPLRVNDYTKYIKAGYGESRKKVKNKEETALKEKLNGVSKKLDKLMKTDTHP